MSITGQMSRGARAPGLRVDGLATGEVEVEEYGYGLGPPTGLMVLHYPRQAAVPDFPNSRNDFTHQLYWSPDGVLAATRGSRTAFAGPDRAVWARRGAVVEVAALGRQRVLRCCLRQAPPAVADQASAVVGLSPRTAEGLLEIVRPGVTEARGLAVREVLMADLSVAEVAPLDFAAVEDGPARAVASALLRDPADPTSLADWARRLHVSAKTLQRCFERDYGCSFSQWRTRTRLALSIALLRRHTVTETAHLVGYATASAYVAAFRRAYGVTPARYVATAPVTCEDVLEERRSG
ncbi:AraC family transcriptional regulator [Nocardioides panacisoli]|uniref:helix-turn-helix transcriptional regulator n=1 Tax=Nocardioides panacisoli TaxID=627624 RepID=UPI001C6256D7|nr:AraC family transcriptional regulator [Nocardioides panacisoli]QYJ02796.1 AraC family transcriptional regulator [Nocardioides panacisoli]